VAEFRDVNACHQLAVNIELQFVGKGGDCLCETEKRPVKTFPNAAAFSSITLRAVHPSRT